MRARVAVVRYGAPLELRIVFCEPPQEAQRALRAMISEQWIKGYTQVELDSAQRRFDLEFPPDLIALLREKRRANGHDWTNDAEIRRALAWPFEGLLVDVEQITCGDLNGERGQPT